jgi:hypothetical protein
MNRSVVDSAFISMATGQVTDEPFVGESMDTAMAASRSPESLSLWGVTPGIAAGLLIESAFVVTQLLPNGSFSHRGSKTWWRNPSG